MPQDKTPRHKWTKDAIETRPLFIYFENSMYLFAR